MRYLLLIALFLPINLHGQIVREVDEFTGDVTLRSEVNSDLSVETRGIISAKFTPIYFDSFPVIKVDFISPNRIVPSGSIPVYFLVDGERMVFEVVDKRENEIYNVHTSVYIPIDQQEFESISEADTVRFRINEIVLSMPYENRESIRDIIAAYKEE